MVDLSIEQSALARVIWGIRPSDDDFGLVRWPPKGGWPLGGVLGPLRNGPWPEPWRAVSLASMPIEAAADVLHRVVHLRDVAEAAGSADTAYPVIERMLFELDEELCPPPPPIPPIGLKFPIPPIPDPWQLLTIGAAFQLRSEAFSGERLGELLGNSATKFFQTALEQIAVENRN
jgi:hypothetical protein